MAVEVTDMLTFTLRCTTECVCSPLLMSNYTATANGYTVTMEESKTT